ncbi:peptidoglycan-recognition protein SC2-like [Amblyomma americanum]
MQKTGSSLLAFAALGAVLIATTVEAQQCPGVEIVPRSGWGARAPRSRVTMKDPKARYVFIHHTTGPQCRDKASCSRSIRGHQNYHMDKNGWPDIGYSFLVGGDGRVYEGRGWGRVGAHTKGYNSNGIAISFVGDFTTATPSNSMLNAAKNLIACGVKMGKIRSTYSLHGHRDANCTACPGSRLYAIIKKWARYGGQLKKYC